MSGVSCYSIDLNFEAIHDMCLFGGLTYEYNWEIKERDLKMLADSIRLEYPLPPLVICRETDKRGSVIVGKKLVATINKLVSTEAYKRLVIETRYKSLHVIIVESSSPNDIANIQRLYGRFVI